MVTEPSPERMERMKAFEKLDREQIKTLQEAYKLHGEIYEKIISLATMNMSLAYGVIRLSENVIDALFAQKIQVRIKTQQETKQEGVLNETK